MVINGVEYKTGMGIKKKDARLKAAELALQDLLPTLESLKSVFPEASGLSLNHLLASVLDITVLVINIVVSQIETILNK